MSLTDCSLNEKRLFPPGDKTIPIFIRRRHERATLRMTVSCAQRKESRQIMPLHRLRNLPTARSVSNGLNGNFTWGTRRVQCPAPGRLLQRVNETGRQIRSTHLTSCHFQEHGSEIRSGICEDLSHVLKSKALKRCRGQSRISRKQI